MTYPTAYDPAVTFATEEAASTAGRSTVRTIALDAELTSISARISQIISCITAITRSDAALLDGVVTIASLSTVVQAYLTAAGGSIKGAWLTATAYVAKDVVTNGTGTYICAVAHTSGTFATDLAAVKWVKLYDVSAFAASGVTFTPTGGISSANVQAAIAELDSEAAKKASNLSDLADRLTAFANLVAAGGTMTGGLTFSRARVNEAQGANIASAATIDLSAATGNLVDVTGTTAITAITLAQGSEATVRFTGSLTLTHGVSLVLPGGVSITTAAGDFAIFRGYTAGVVRCVTYSKANGRMVSGDVNYYANRLINGNFQIDQRVNSATARADDAYCLDRWYVLTQTASVQVTQQTDQEDGTPYNIRLTQNQAAAQRMGLAQIIEAKDCKDLRAKVVALAARVRISTSQALRYAILEWTGTADSVTSDVVLDWTSGSYTAGGFFLAANLTVSAVGSMTPSAVTWTDFTELSATLGSSGNNIIIFVWTEGTAAQNVTLDIARARFAQGTAAPAVQVPPHSDELRRCQRFYWKSFPVATAPAQSAGTTGAISAQSRNGGGAGGLGAVVVFPVRMLAAPTVTTYNPSAANANWRLPAGDATVTIDQTNDWGVSLESSTAVSLAQQGRIHMTAEAEL